MFQATAETLQARRSRPEHSAPDWTGTVLLDKLSPPPLGFAPLPRPRLLQALTRGVASTPVTLLSGPAGSGKTVLAATWMRAQQGRRLAWLSVDAGDDDPAVFPPHLLAALRQAGLALPDLPARGSGAPAAGAWPTGLAAALAAQPEPVVLILDNADNLTARELTGALDLLVRHTGARLRLVLCARADPLLPLHRYRLDDRLTEIRTDDLAFTAEETGELLASLGAPVAADVAAALQRGTEGWAAALRLAAAPLTQGMDPDRLLASLAADDGSVAQYLVAEVLEHQPTAVRRFLLRVSATRELWPELVDSLAGRPGGGRILAGLAAEHAFVERAAGAPGGYRIHALFRELLQGQLAYEDPVAFATGHHLCADWYAAAGRLAVAVEHARAAGDQKLAARLLIDDLAVGHLLTRGSARGAPPVSTGGPDAAVLRAATALAADRPAALPDLTVAAAVAGDSDARPALRIGAAVVCAAAVAAGPVADRVRAAAVTAESLIAALPDGQAQRRAELTAVLACSQAMALLTSELPERALREAFARALAAGRACDAPRLDARCLADLALLEALVGRLRRATKLAADYESLADEGRLPEPDRAPAAAITAAWAAVDRHELATARRWLTRAAQRRPDLQISSPLLAVLNSRLRRARGELDPAEQALQPALDMVGTPGWVREHVLTEAIRIRLARHDGPGAQGLLDRLPPGSPRRRVMRATATALGLSAVGEGLAAPGAADAGGPLPLGLAVEDAVVRACLLAAAGDTATSLATLDNALHLAEPERLRRPFLDAPPRLRPLLRAHPPLATVGAWLNPTAPAIPTPRHPAEAITGSPGPKPPSAIIGELSPRELEVLQLLAGMLSTAEIAAALFISVNTVRTHVRTILRKLGATRRNEAVRRARELHLLAPTAAPPGHGSVGDRRVEGTAT
ncbi:LuxR C-terminal-related transcriptional regulator [Geodermatophilus sp. SYSU D01186]